MLPINRDNEAAPDIGVYAQKKEVTLLLSNRARVSTSDQHDRCGQAPRAPHRPHRT